ncbi:MAG: hypothetical protein H6838_17360 [Planctomycetes bacterium]|nr:hypothetical protein [Planctomycetota bacterium]MCB9887262.1 hypothetical protein [Planctomycetota bacterium]
MPRSLAVALLACLPATLLAQAPQNPTFTEHIAPIVFKSCTGCHRPGEVAPFALRDYKDVRKRAKNLLSAIEDRFMPPWHPSPGYGSFRDDPRLADEQIETFRNWVKTGMPEGPPEALPKLPEFAEGWQLGEPDLVLTTSGPFEVPARGRDIYRNFAIPLGLDEDKWLTAIEVRPSARSVLHHTLVFLDEQRQMQAQEGKDGRPGFSGMRLQRGALVAGWAVGGMPSHLPEGLAIKLPKGSDLVLQSHLHPSGKKEQEQTTIGLYFRKEAPQRTLVSVQLPPFFGFTAGIDIPPGEKEYRLHDSFELPCAVDAVTVGGHAHMLCRTMKMYAVLPDGGELPLLMIDDWDFDWQNRYTFKSLVRIPKGAVLHAELVYDNSKDNPNNPSKPPKRVRWGQQTEDEMGSITLLVVPADEKDLDTLLDAVGAKNAEKAISRAQQAIDAQFANYDKNKDGKLQKNEVPRRLQPFFEQLDKDGDGALTPDEAKAITDLLRGMGRGLGGLPGAGRDPGGPGKGGR